MFLSGNVFDIVFCGFRNKNGFDLAGIIKMKTEKKLVFLSA